MDFGVYLPFEKSQMYIEARAKAQQQIHSLNDFNKIFDPVLNFYSPVGQEEIVAKYLEILVSVIKSQKDRDVVDYFIDKAESLTDPTIEKGAGFSFSQILLSLGDVYQAAYSVTNDEAYYSKAVKTFRLGLTYSPNRSAFLYSLLGLYSGHQDKAGVTEIGNTILKFWPDNVRVREEVRAALP